MRRVIERAVTEISRLRQRRSDKDQRRSRNLGFLNLGADIGQRAVDIVLIRPADTIGHNHRAILAIERHKVALDLAQVPDRQMNGQCRAGSAKTGQFLARRHGG